uniref:alpha-amylase n=1 Tax=Pygocentrus nattereri TaxID=42514 RepID=A0AAR2JY35_PYGNA
MKLLVLAGLFGLSLGQHDPHMKHGRTSIVHLFEWRWADIATECERYLAPKGFGGVQISPPSESIVVTNPWHPWWQRYQPISYNLCSRSGTEEELRDMITRCNNVGVKSPNCYYITYRLVCAGEGHHSSCGTYFDANKKNFPSVPFSSLDFNDGKCKTANGGIENYHNIFQVRDCQLVGLLDLAMEKDSVRGKVAEYMNKLIDMGVAGFRMDACKHMWPGDLSAVYDRLHNLSTKWFSSGLKPFIYQEVIDLGGEPIKASEYFGLGRVTEFKYSAKLGTVVRKWENEKLCYLKSWGEGWAFMPSDKAVVFVDNHDNQRGHGAGGASILTFWDARLYKMAMGIMLAHPYGVTRVMSSYRWDRNFENGKDKNDWMGPPSHGNGSTKAVPINPDTTCGDGWVCEHRWRQIRNMVNFRNVVDGQPISNWWDNGHQIAFGRGSRGFIVINNDDWNLRETLSTGLPGGIYCDIISGDKLGGGCTGKQIRVDKDGRAHFSISNWEDDPFIAIHVEAKL